MDTVALIVTYLLFIGAAMSTFYFLLLVNKKNRTTEDKILAMWFLFLTINLFSSFFVEKIVVIYPISFGIIILVFTAIHNPFLFFYVRSITSEKRNSNVSYLAHLLPIIAIAIIVFFWYSNKTQDEQLMYYHSFNKGDFLNAKFLSVMTVVDAFLAMFYIVRSLLLIYRHQKRINDIFSDTENVNLKWAEYFAIGWGFIWVFAMAQILIIFIANGSISFSIYHIGVGCFVLLILYLGFQGAKQQQIFAEFLDDNSGESENTTDMLYEDTDNDREFSDNKKYLKSGLKETETEEYLKMIVHRLENDKPYLESEIKIADFANDLDIPPHFVSQIINDKLGKNFYNLINSYRINEFKKRLADAKYKKFTILSIALDCGFNSNSSFYRIFKSIEGLSPSEYQKLVRQ